MKQQTNSFGNRLIQVNLPKCRDVIAKGRPIVYVKSFPINKRPGLNFLNEVQEQCKKNSECDALTETMFQYERYRLAFYEIALQLRRWRRIALSGCVAGALLIIILIALWVKTNGMP